MVTLYTIIHLETIWTQAKIRMPIRGYVTVYYYPLKWHSTENTKGKFVCISIKHGFVSGSDVHNLSKTTADNATTVHYIAYPSFGSNMESNVYSFTLNLHMKICIM
jgi:hypothetical protein